MWATGEGPERPLFKAPLYPWIVGQVVRVTPDESAAITLMIVLTAVRRVMGIGTAHDPILIFTALLPWTFFSASVTASTNSLVVNAHMVRKVYFPRLVLPLASIGAPLADYAIASLVLLGIFGPHVLFLVLYIGGVLRRIRYVRYANS